MRFLSSLALFLGAATAGSLNCRKHGCFNELTRIEYRIVKEFCWAIANAPRWEPLPFLSHGLDSYNYQQIQSACCCYVGCPSSASCPAQSTVTARATLSASTADFTVTQTKTETQFATVTNDVTLPASTDTLPPVTDTVTITLPAVTDTVTLPASTDTVVSTDDITITSDITLPALTSFVTVTDDITLPAVTSFVTVTDDITLPAVTSFVTDDITLPAITSSVTITDTATATQTVLSVSVSVSVQPFASGYNVGFGYDPAVEFVGDNVITFESVTDAANAHSGSSYGYVVFNPSINGGDITLQVTVPVEANTEYVADGYYKKAPGTGTCTVGIAVLNEAGNGFLNVGNGGTYHLHTLTTAYTYDSTAFDTGANSQVTVRYGSNCYNQDGGSIYYDDLSLHAA